eukprot:TRINITY_DN44920_c0_g1_i2.p1 TRINITY_DN44920_c0_g1~~TRINITY_DN44920_c0_g1_i2.p1  ORF type:complete len:546 (-),score=80.37 TRINITY_DN44920_c0_g1_i2:109-1746(-)
MPPLTRGPAAAEAAAAAASPSVDSDLGARQGDQCVRFIDSAPPSAAPSLRRNSMDAEKRPPYSGLNPIVLKAMAMKLRHRAQGVRFRKVGDALQELGHPLLRDQNKTDTMTSNLLILAGPENLIGLRTIFLHPLSILLFASPLGAASWYYEWSSASTFFLNFTALVPLAKVLGDCTEELSAAINSDTISGLLNASFGNAVEMIVAVQSLRVGLLSVVKQSLLGSVLSNVLLVLGMSFFCGGLTKSKRRKGQFYSFQEPDYEGCWITLEKEQKFAVKTALVSTAMLLFSCTSFALPTVFDTLPTNDVYEVLKVSRIGAVIVFLSYLAFLFFQLVTHKNTLSKEETDLAVSSSRQAQAAQVLSPPTDQDSIDLVEEDDDDGGPGLTAPCAILCMVLCTLVVAANSDFLVDALEPVVHDVGIPQSFIGVILLPIAGNACEHAAAIRFAMRDRPGLAIGIAVGSSTQVALFVVPFSVIVGWAMCQPLDLNFGLMNTSVMILSVLVLLTLILDGRSNWFKGYLLMSLYTFIGVLYWYYPQLEEDHRPLVC